MSRYFYFCASVIFSISVFYACGNENYPYDIQGAFAKCRETIPVTQEYLLAINISGKFPDETDRGPKCIFNCTWKEIDIIGQDNKISIEKGRDFIEHRYSIDMDTSLDISKECGANRDEPDECEMAYQLIKCYRKKILDMRGY